MARSLLSTLLISCFISLPFLPKAQTVLYGQDFEGTSPLSGYVLSNLDKGNPVSSGYASLADSAWVCRSLAGFSKCVIGTSDYNPAMQANDWFITPAVKLGSYSKLEWKSQSLTAGKEDSYEVYISPSEQSVAGCLISSPVLTAEAEGAGSFTTHSLDLNALGYGNQYVYFGFRLNTLSGGDKLAIDDIVVSDDSLQDAFSLNFVVNMSKYIADSLFNPRTDTVDVAGTFNGWDGTKSILSLVPDSDSSIYSISIPGFRDGDYLEFKFRINSSWSDTSLEFPYGGPNRTWMVTGGMNTYTTYYNESGAVSGIDDGISGGSGISVNPNPVHERLNITVPRTVSSLRVLSSKGETVISRQLNGSVFTEDVSDLAPGLYIFLFYDRKGLVESRKVLKY